MLTVLWALLGVLAAVLLNHLADRLPQHRELRSAPACPACGHPYRPVQWLALLSLVGSRCCNKCGQALPARRWLVELATAGLYGYLGWRYGLSWTLVGVTFHASVLLAITVTDLETRRVPNALVLPASAAAILLTALTAWRSLGGVLLGGGLAFALFLLLALIYPGGMGLGDVKLAGYVGLLAGYPRVLVCLLVAVVAGGLAAAILLATRKATRRTYIPYAPFLALGGMLALLI